MYLHRSIIDPEPDDRLRKHRLRPVKITVDTSHFPTSVLNQPNASFMRFQKRIQAASLTSWQIALIVVGALVFLALIYALYTIHQLRKSKQTGQYSIGANFFGLLSRRRSSARRGASTSRRRDARSKRRRGSTHLSSADTGGAGMAMDGREDDDKEMDSPVKLSRLLKSNPSQATHRSLVGASPSTIAMMHYHHNSGEEEEVSPPPPPTGSTLRPSTGFTSSSSITHTSLPAPYLKDGSSLRESVSIKEYASTKERASEQMSPSIGSPISSPINSSPGDPLSTSVKSTGGFSLGNTLSAALDKHRHRRGSKSSTNTTPTSSSLQNTSNLDSGLASSPPRSGSGRPRSQTQSHTQTKSHRSRNHANRSQTRTLDDGLPHGSPPTSAGGPSSPLSPSSLGTSLGLFGRPNSSSAHSHSLQTPQQSKPHHGSQHHLPKEDSWRDRESGRERDLDFDDRESIAHTIRESFGDDNDYSRTEGEMDIEMDEQISTSFTTQSGTGSASGTSNAHTYAGDVTPRGASAPRIASPRASTKRLGSSHSTASYGYSFTPPTTAMSRTTFAENGVAVPFSGIGLAFGRAGRDNFDPEGESKRADRGKERSRRRGRERNEE